jgi:predicted transcriptional regulator
MESTRGERYDLAEMDLKSFTRSSIRTKVMFTLLDEGKTANELGKIMNARSTTILHSMKSLMDSDLVFKKQQKYCLTNIGKIQAIMLNELVDTIVTIKEHHDFWLNHDLGGIPDELQRRIGMLGQGEIFKDPKETPLKSLDSFLAALTSSKVIRGVSPVTIRGYPEAISHMVKSGAHVELILTDTVLKVIISEHGEMLKEILNRDNFKLYSMDEDAKVTFIVTESYLNLGLPRTDGSFDLGADLIYSGEKAVQWGNMLYNYYLPLSTRFMDI